MTFDGAGDFFIEYLDLPVSNVTDGLSSDRYYIPGSLLRAEVNESIFTWGMPNEVAVSFSNSSAYARQGIEYSGEGGQENTVKRVGLNSVDSGLKTVCRISLR